MANESANGSCRKASIALWVRADKVPGRSDRRSKSISLRHELIASAANPRLLPEKAP